MQMRCCVDGYLLKVTGGHARAVSSLRAPRLHKNLAGRTDRVNGRREDLHYSFRKVFRSAPDVAHGALRQACALILITIAATCSIPAARLSYPVLQNFHSGTRLDPGLFR